MSYAHTDARIYNTHIYIHISTHAHTHTNIHTQDTYIRLSFHRDLNTRFHIHTTCEYTNAHTCTWLCKHTYTRKCIHTCAFTHACTRVCTYKSLCMYTSLTSHTHILSHFNIYRWRLNIRQHVWFLVGRPWAFEFFFCLAEDVFKSWKNASDNSNRRRMNSTTGGAGPARPAGPPVSRIWSFGQRSSA